MTFLSDIKNFGFLLILLLFISCKKTNWRENFKEKQKSPFGTYIIYNEVKELFKEKEVFYLNENIHDYLYNNYIDKGDDFGNYICIKNNANKLNEAGLKDLLASVYSGSNAFLSLNYFSNHLKETLEITTNNLDKNKYQPSKLKALKGTLTLKNEAFKNQPYTFDRNIRRHYFITYNEKNTIVLGNINVDGENLPNFIKIYHGKGAVYLHTNPVVFTNYFLLNGNDTYARNLLSYLPTEAIFWDPQIKWSKRSKNNKEDKESIFKFFLQHATLTWFLFLSLGSLLLFMLFNTRRKQRAVPVIEPLKNSTVAFTQTIANLYLQEEDHKNLANKKITYFLEKVRTKYLINTQNLNSDFIEKLALKSGNKLQNTKYLINTIITLNRRHQCSEEDLMVLHKMIENFFKK